MNYKNLIYLITIFFVTNCTTSTLNENKLKTTIDNVFINKGFTLIYTDDLYKKRLISKKIDPRSYIIFQKNLKKNTTVKITNLINGRSLLAKVGNNATYPLFNNSVITLRISKDLEIDVKEPYIEIVSIQENSMFTAKKAKTFDEEKQVAGKAPVDEISINDLRVTKKVKKEKKNTNFKYIIKIADFYFENTAYSMIERIKKETSLNNIKIQKISLTEYRVLLGPFDDINSLQSSFNDINILEFENIEIIKK